MKKQAGVLKMEEVEIPQDPKLLRRGSLQHTGSRGNGGTHCYFTPLSNWKGLIWSMHLFASGAWLCGAETLSEIDGADAGGVTDESNHNGIKSSNDIKPGIPHLFLSMWWLKMTKIAIGYFDNVALKVSFLGISTSWRIVLFFSNSQKIAPVCPVSSDRVVN